MRTSDGMQGKRRQSGRYARALATLRLVAAFAGATYGALTRDQAPSGAVTAAAVSDGLTPRQADAGWRRALGD